ncbi:MAG: hypothetical protein IPP90_03710 [Gemmatimonadaceae bacterium]|nr:hypothetical protein [Gemmatimonadaceae bacterium]
MTRAPSLVGLFVAPLNRARIDYAVTGGLAAIVYGHPRLTLDVDLVIRLGATDTVTFASLWSPGEFYCPPADVIEEERARESHGHFNVIHHDTAMRADVYLAGNDPLQEWALAHRVEREIQGETVRFAPIEYVIVYKLRYAQMGGSDRHLRDIARMIEVNESDIDNAVLDGWIAHFGLAERWARAQSMAGQD